MLKKILPVLLIVCIAFTSFTMVSANSLLDDVFEQGGNFGGTTGDTGLGDKIEEFITDEVKPAVFAIGNLIFAAITVILGVKFIWSGADGKAQVQETLPSFVIAVIFFYLAQPLVDFVTGSTTGIASADDWGDLAGSVLWVINTVVKYLALGGLVYVGIKYLLASAEGKASLKTSMSGVVLGVIFVFLASNVVDFIISAGNEIL